MREGPRISVVIALAAILVVVVVGAAQIAQRVTGGSRPKVAIVGDSITAQAKDLLVRSLSSGYHLAIDGRSNYRVAEQLPAAARMAGGDPEQVIIDLGSNDVGSEVPADESAASLAEMVALFPAARCVHLVTINESMGVPTAAKGPVLARDLNARIRALAATDPRIRIVDWAQIVRDFEAVNGPGSATSDTVHPTWDGQRVLIAAYQRSLDSCPAPAPTAS